MSTPEEQTITAIRAKGSDATDIRDAAHEACHALEFGAVTWTRNGVHAALERGCDGPAHMLRAEIRARAVERLVCQEFEVEYDAEHWMMMAWMETIKNGIQGVPMKFWEGAVQNAMDNLDTHKLVEQILDLRDA